MKKSVGLGGPIWCGLLIISAMSSVRAVSAVRDSVTLSLTPTLSHRPSFCLHHLPSLSFLDGTLSSALFDRFPFSCTLLEGVWLQSHKCIKKIPKCLRKFLFIYLLFILGGRRTVNEVSQRLQTQNVHTYKHACECAHTHTYINIYIYREREREKERERDG